jgi:hypothetical protein
MKTKNRKSTPRASSLNVEQPLPEDFHPSNVAPFPGRQHKKSPAFRGAFLIYLPMPEPGPVGILGAVDQG